MSDLARTDPSPMTLLDKAIASGMDVDKLGRLMDLAERWQANQAAVAMKAALAGFSKDCPPVEKKRTADAGGKFGYQYASYDDVNRVAKPHMANHGLSISYDTETPKPGIVKVTARVSHEAGGQMTTTLEVPIPVMSVNDTQRFGAAVSYAKRFAMCAALNIVVTDEDVDGANLEFITLEEAEELSAMLLQVGPGTHLPKFVKWAGGVPPTVEDLAGDRGVAIALAALQTIPGANLKKARDFLIGKLKEKGETYP